MRKHQLLLTLLLMFASMATFAQSKDAEPLKAFNQADGTADIWGFLTYDMKYRTNGVVKFNSAKPDEYSLLKDYGREVGTSKYLTAATYVGDKLYGYCATYYGSGALVPHSIVTVNPDNGECTTLLEVDPYTGLLFNDMTYDPVTGLIYAIAYNEDSNNPTSSYSALYTIDPTSCEMTYVTRINYLLLAISADKGALYGLARDMSKNYDDVNNSFLIRIPAQKIADKTYTPETFSGDPRFGINAYYLESMEFDKTTHQLWWLTQPANGYPTMVEIDPETGKAKSKKQMYLQAQIIGLSIPYQTGEDDAPSLVSNLKIAVADKGEMQATLTWNNPSKNFAGNTLESIEGVKIYRNGNIVDDVDESVVGQAGCTCTDNTITKSGYYTYRLVPYNSYGDGAYKEIEAFIGRDVPGKVTDLTLSTNGNTATITWAPSAKGAHDGWYDQAALTYRVVRQPDNKVVASATTATTITDNVSTFSGYYYQVTAKNNEGEGETASSNVVPFGPAMAIPYTNSLQTSDEFNQWKILDNNADGTTWQFNEGDKVTNYFWSLNNADDYLVSPSLNFEEGKQYQVRFTYYTSNYVTADTREPVMEKMRVRYGTEATKEGLSTVIEDLGSFHTPSLTYLHGKSTFTPKAGTGYVAFDACSDGSSGIIYLKDVSVREYSATDISATELNGSMTANVGTKYAFGVNVVNEGSAAVNQYRVEVYNTATGKVISTKDVTETLEAGASRNESMEWTPDQEGQFTFGARVILDGDTYPLDNDCASHLMVTVSPASSAKWLTVNKDALDEAYGWTLPFNFGDAYTQVQVIYLNKEMQLKNINLTGAQFLYNSPDVTSALTREVRISIAETDRDYFNIVDHNVDFIDADYKTVYEGKITVNANKLNSPVTITFDKPFTYKGGNIVVKYETLFDTDYVTDNQQPLWHYADNYDDGDPLYNRSAIWRSETSTEVVSSKIGVMYWTPFTMFSYDTANGIGGLVAPTNAAFNLTQQGSTLHFGSKMDQVDLISTSGAVVRSARATSTLNVEGLHGAYLVRVNTAGKTLTMKYVIK